MNENMMNASTIIMAHLSSFSDILTEPSLYSVPINRVNKKPAIVTGITIYHCNNPASPLISTTPAATRAIKNIVSFSCSIFNSPILFLFRSKSLLFRLTVILLNQLFL